MKVFTLFITILVSGYAIATASVEKELVLMLEKVDRSNLSDSVKEDINQPLQNILDFHQANRADSWWESEFTRSFVIDVLESRNQIAKEIKSRLKIWRTSEGLVGGKFIFCTILKGSNCAQHGENDLQSVARIKRREHSVLKSLYELTKNSLPTFIAPLNSELLKEIHQKEDEFNKLCKYIEGNL